MAVLGVVLVAELGAIALSLARESHWVSFFADLGGTSFVLQWLSLTSAAVLCAVRPVAARLSLPRGTALVLGAVAVNIVVLSEAMYWLAHAVAPEVAAHGWLPDDHLFFAARNLAIGGVATGVLLRYFYVSDQWQRNVRQQAEARLHALQARIRPHFLFNSMNTIASLARSNPSAAEQAVEDLADLFRASLTDARERIALAEELEIARVYERMERQRLGERLAVEWQLDGVPTDAAIPSLTLQPLLENAIYHGIERTARPGTVEIVGRREGDMLRITITNPLPPTQERRASGNQMALENIGQRLALAFGGRAGLDVEPGPDSFRVVLVFPYQPAPR
jgi:two-component system sensor histidine kinase AlgZ